MSVLCVFGFCIPYSVMWPLLLLAVKQVVDMLFPKSTRTKSVVEQAPTPPNATVVGTATPSLPVTFDKSMDWNALTGADKPVIVRFSAKWCKPCNELGPLFDQLCGERGLEAVFVTVDVDEFDEIAALNGAISIPLFVSYKSGTLLRSYRGKDESKIREFVDHSILPTISS